MKKQINRSIKAHLLWSALILLSLLAICAIPFALAQRNTAKSSVRPAYSTTRSDAPFPKPQTALLPQRPAVCTLNDTLGTAPPGGGTGSIATRISPLGSPTVMCGVAPTWPGNTDTGPFIYNVHYITNSGASPLCTAVALHLLTPGLLATNIQCSAFRAPFAAGDITNQTRYLGDAGVSTGNPLFIPFFQLTVPAGATIALVVFNVNLFPAGQGAVYELLLDQDIFCQQVTPTPTPSPTPGCSIPPPGACTSYEAELTQNTLEGSAIVLDCPTCSNGAKVSYVGSNSGTLQFNNVAAVAPGNYTVTICYLNGDAVRYALLSVNGSEGTPVSFPSTGSFHTVGSIQTTVTLNTGCNTLKFYNPIVGNWAPDFDRIQFNCPTCAVSAPSPTPTPTPSPTATPTPSVTPGYDFNGDGHPDYLLSNMGTRQTVVWYMNNNVPIGAAYAPTLPVGWMVIDVADFNSDGHPDYALFNPGTRRTAVWYLNNNVYIGGAYGPTLPSAWALVATGGFNGDAKPDYVLYNASSRQTAIWYLNNNVYIGGGYGPTLPSGWGVVGVADFNGDGKADYLLFNASTRQSAIWYLSGRAFVSGAYGPTIASGYVLTGAADFNGDGKPDYVLYNGSSRQTAIWYLNNNVYVGGAYGPTLPAGWSLAAP